jgi:Flp pilus assembly pilin Flp
MTKAHRGQERAFTHGGRLMDLLRKLHLKPLDFARGQTMAEYVLIVAAVAVVAFAGYQATGTTVSTLVSSVDTQL